MCIFDFDSLLELDTRKLENGEIGVEVLGVVKKKNGGYFLYDTQADARADNARRRIRVGKMLDEDIEREPPELQGVDVVVVGIYRRIGTKEASIDIYSVRTFKFRKKGKDAQFSPSMDVFQGRSK